MNVSIIDKNSLINSMEEMKNVSSTESMLEIAKIQTDDETIHVFLDKNDGYLGCLCEDDECQFNEEDVSDVDDVLDYIVGSISLIMFEHN